MQTSKQYQYLRPFITYLIAITQAEIKIKAAMMAMI